MGVVGRRTQKVGGCACASKLSEWTLGPRSTFSFFLFSFFVRRGVSSLGPTCFVGLAGGLDFCGGLVEDFGVGVFSGRWLALGSGAKRLVVLCRWGV